MVNIDEVICREFNPFDPLTFRVENFWDVDQRWTATVDSIHQQELQQIEEFLNQVTQDHQTRSLLLVGESGCGKSYMLGRLKQQLNDKAFFVYIGPWDDDTYLWRHILRYTVESLMQKPEGQQESQLLLWLKSLSAFTSQGLFKNLLGEKGLFVKNLRTTYPVGVFQAQEFFSGLYGLTQPDRYLLACDWLKGDSLDEDSLNLLGVKTLIDSEEAARGILKNIGTIATATQPIVLCFDQIDRVASDSRTTLAALWSINSSIHNDRLKNFCLIISLVKETWENNKGQMLKADRARFQQGISLKNIDLEQAAALWAIRLQPLHQQADPLPESPFHPLYPERLSKEFPGGKTTPRAVLKLGDHLYRLYKSSLINLPSIDPDQQTVFPLVWENELRKVQAEVKEIGQFASYELVGMLRDVLLVFQVPLFMFSLGSTYGAYGVGMNWGKPERKIALVWSEDANLTKFCNLMKQCQKALDQNSCDRLYLIRASTLGNPKNKGYQLFRQIFSQSAHRHLTPDLPSVQALATYRRLVNAACAGELVVADETPNLEALQQLVRTSKCFQDFALVQKLEILVPSPGLDRVEPSPNPSRVKLPPTGSPVDGSVRIFLLQFMQSQMFIAREKLMENAQRQFPQVTLTTIADQIQQLCGEKKLKLLDPGADLEKQLICYVPPTAP